MNGVLVPCLDCADLTPAPVLGRCEECAAERKRTRERGRQRTRENRTDRVGSSNTRWKALSRRARRAQPWCSSCRETDQQVTARGDRLEVDHTPQAWQRERDGLTIRLSDVDVLCGDCNRAAGSAQPGSQRWIEWESQHAE